MWPHRDLAWWGFVLSIAAIVLAYPLSLLANLTTPKLKDWWAKRSKSALQKRIEFLDKEMGKVEKWTGEMSVGEDLIMTTLWYLHSFVTASITEHSYARYLDFFGSKRAGAKLWLFSLSFWRQ